MDNFTLDKVKKILHKYKQDHLLSLYDTLSENEQNILINQILNIDFDEIISLYNNSMKDEHFDFNEISPLNHLEKKDFSSEELKYYSLLGEDVLKCQSYAVVTMAGGQGTRLGYKGPKGTYMLDLHPRKKSLFEILCENIKSANAKYDIVIPWYIMTSTENDIPTKNFFEKNNYFDYPKDKIVFFTQDKLPIIDVDGKIILQEPYLIKEASNGNGNVFFAMRKHGIIDDMEQQGVKWIFFGGVDNVLLKNVDPFFVGLAVAKGEEIASKSIFKQNPLDKVAVYCKKLGKPSILYYENIDLEISEMKDLNGNFLYRESNILAHLMSINAVKRVMFADLPYHRAYKKNAFVNFEGVKQVPDKPNSFKFESFIFDAFAFFDDMLLLRVDEDEEFAPIKDFTGIYNPDSAREKYERFNGTIDS